MTCQPRCGGRKKTQAMVPWSGRHFAGRAGGKAREAPAMPPSSMVPYHSRITHPCLCGTLLSRPSLMLLLRSAGRDRWVRKGDPAKDGPVSGEENFESVVKLAHPCRSPYDQFPWIDLLAKPPWWPLFSKPGWSTRGRATLNQTWRLDPPRFDGDVQSSVSIRGAFGQTPIMIINHESKSSLLVSVCFSESKPSSSLTSLGK